MGLQIQKEKNSIILTLVKELDREDVEQLHSDLGQWLYDSLPNKTYSVKGNEIRLDNQNAGPSGVTFHNPAHQQAFEQAQSKNKLAEEMRRCFIDLLESEYVQKELKVYQLDPITKEVEIKSKNLKDGKKGI